MTKYACGIIQLKRCNTFLKLNHQAYQIADNVYDELKYE